MYVYMHFKQFGLLTKMLRRQCSCPKFIGVQFQQMHQFVIVNLVQTFIQDHFYSYQIDNLKRIGAIHRDFVFVQNSIQFINILMLFSLIVLFGLVVSIGASSHMVYCNDIPTGSLQNNLQYLWGKAILHDFDRYLFLTLCPIIFVIQVTILVILKNYSGQIDKSRNIFFAIVLFQLLMNLNYLATSIYYSIEQSNAQMPSSFPNFCITNALISGFLQTIHIEFILLFPIYIVYLLRFTLKSNSKMWNIIYIIAIVAAIILTWIFWNFNLLGLNIFGLCSFSFIRMPNLSFALLLTMTAIIVVFLLVGIFTIKYFKRHMPNTIGLRKNKYNKNKVLIYYIIGFSVFLIVNFAINIVELFSCKQNSPSQQQIMFLVSLVNALRLVQFIFIFFVIFKNQSFLKNFKKIWKSIFKKANSRQQIDIELNKIGSLYKAPDLEVDYEQYLLDIKQQKDELDILKISQIITIISGIYVAYKQYYNLSQNQYQSTLGDETTTLSTKSHSNARRSTKKIYYYQKMTVSIDAQIIKEYMIDLSLIPRLGILACSMTIHAPKVFQRMLQSDNLWGIFKSFELQDNSKKMFNLIEGQGGRSGQFFFFSFDNKYVLKTITQDQFQFLDQNLVYFHDHYKKNPNSLLAKIYGLFTFTGYEIQRTYHLILMKNILGCEKRQIIRTYDLKGSKYDRQVNVDNASNQLEKITLKDIDFMKMEKRIFIKNQLKDKLQQIIENDTIFLKNLNLIDYSLLIIKVKWDYQPKDPHFWGAFQRIQSSAEQNTFYHIGIIDYLQKWDFQKKGQKWWKKLLGKKDISAQQPKKYQLRYMAFVNQIIQYVKLEQYFKAEQDKQQSKMKQEQSIQQRQQPSQRSKQKDFLEKTVTFGIQQKEEEQFNQGVNKIRRQSITITNL